jgi:hypothetical protein
MISIKTARLLQDAGLSWTPVVHDFFAIPDRGFDERTFVISDISTELNMLSGYQAVTFQGALEWTLDYIMVPELVWVPREDQLRGLLVERLQAEQGALRLGYEGGRYTCTIRSEGKELSFDDDDAGECYAGALIYLLSKQRYPQVDAA